MLRRSPDPISLVAGLVFTGIGVSLLLSHGSLHVEPRWVWPGLLILLALALLPGVRGHREQAVEEPPPPPPAAPPASGAGGAAEGL